MTEGPFLLIYFIRILISTLLAYILLTCIQDVNDLIQDITKHLFYLQVKDQILSRIIFAPAEMCVMLASYTLQAKVFFRSFWFVLKSLIWGVLSAIDPFFCFAET